MRSQLKTCSPRVSSSPSSIVPESWAHCQAFADRGDLEKAQAYLTKMSDTQQYYLFMQHAYLLPSPKWYDSPCNMNYFLVMVAEAMLNLLDQQENFQCTWDVCTSASGNIWSEVVRTSSRLSLAVLEQGFSRQTQRQFAAGSSGTIHFDKNSAFVPTIPYPSKQNQVHPSLQQVRFVKS